MISYVSIFWTRGGKTVNAELYVPNRRVPQIVSAFNFTNDQSFKVYKDSNHSRIIIIIIIIVVVVTS
jgi:hypothetical protein